MSDKHKPIVLIIRDGWGVSPSPTSMVEAEGNATLMARTPVQDRLISTCPWTFLVPSGEAVGLPAGQMGNSEVGHLNLGAGRIVYQDLTRISRSIRDGSFFQVPALDAVMRNVVANRSRLHLIGLVSDGGVHSHIDHIVALLEFARREGLDRVLLHCFMDGRDTSPTAGADYLQALEEKASAIGVGRIASLVGRYFAMDRDKRWDRVAKAYNLLVHGEGVSRGDAVSAMREWYAKNKTDEFIPPTVITRPNVNPREQCIGAGDGVIYFNFRSDRARQLTRALTSPDFRDFERGVASPVHFVCMTEYDERLDLPIAFAQQRLDNTFGQVVATNGLRQLRMAETEKYAHVTFFFNGGVEQPVEGEDRCLISSPKVATYDLQPEMSALELTDQLISHLRSHRHEVVIVNYANPDMVGHSGNIPATIRAVETVDQCVGRVLEVIAEVGGRALVTADHGNAERMIDENGKPHTAHTSNHVHLFYVGSDRDKWRLEPGILADVAPTMLQMLGLPAPKEMTGRCLLVPRVG